MDDRNNSRLPRRSKMRNIYLIKLAVRIVIFGLFTALYRTGRVSFALLEGMNFFHSFSILHLLWGIWMIDMLLQIVPARNQTALGSQKLFGRRFRPAQEKVNDQLLKQYIISSTKSAYASVFLIWAILIVLLGILYSSHKIDQACLLFISVFFYVCDLICVLVWCPFRLMLHNRCCTTCRIFNWDHLMMFSPLLYIRGFYSRSLFLMSVFVWAIWEISVFRYPQRFWEKTNDALKCGNCTDKLCTQYCEKRLRNKNHSYSDTARKTEK